jgi:aminoglycoside phosphotransferase (APT) family kinase protein
VGEHDKARALLGVLADAGAAAPADQVTYLQQLEGGWSRHSYIAHVQHGNGTERSYVIRVRPVGSQVETDLAQEFRVYALLQEEPIPTPAVHGYEPSEITPFGGPFFVMDRLPGYSPNVWRARDRRALEADWSGARGIASGLVEHLAMIHTIKAERATTAAAERSFTEIIDHWQGVYEHRRLVRDPIVDEAYAWLREREPDPVEPCLVHGDYRIGNCLLDGGHIMGILDWELCYVGDPRFDLGYLELEYYAGKFTVPGSSLLNAVCEREWFHDRYTRLSGRPVDADVLRTFSVLGGVMLITIMTTGVRVFADGSSDDIRMAWGRFTLPGLRQDLARLMKW